MRVLQEQTFERLGGTQTLRSEARVIEATNRDLPKAVREGKFRKDLFYRLSVFPLHVPPLRITTPMITSRRPTNVTSGDGVVCASGVLR